MREAKELTAARARIVELQQELAFMVFLAEALNWRNWGDDPVVRVDLDRANRVLEGKEA